MKPDAQRHHSLPMTCLPPAARAAVASLVLALGAALPAGAQGVWTFDRDGWRTEARARAQIPAPAAMRGSGPSALHVVLFATGGTVVGGWTGFVASQVVWSDWRNEPGRRAIRTRYSIVGAAVGLLAGVLIGSHSKSKPAPRLGPLAPDPASVDAPITAEQIRKSSARTIRELLLEMRPRWLHSRGLDVIRESNEPDQPRGIRVYLNGYLLGGLDAIDGVSIDTVTEIRFFEPAAATVRWGAGNEDGAILLSTSPAR